MSNVSAITYDSIDSDVAKAMMGQSPDCIKLISGEGQLKFMSDNGKALMEIDDFSKIDGKDWWALWPAESQTTLRDAITAARRGVSISFEAECPTMGGTLKHWLVRVSPVQGGELDGMIIATSQDISANKALEAARDALEQDNLAMRRFTKFVAHDLRGPIRHHKLLSECILSETEPDDISALATQINSSASLLLDMLTGLENLHQAEAKPNITSVSIADLVDRALSLNDRSRLDVSLQGGRAGVLADIGQLTSAFSNLLENCIKYSGQTRCKVQITARTTPDGQTEITITDNGPGFATDQGQDLLQPLARGSNSTSVDGAGLGLAIVDQILRQNGGFIRLEPPQPGAGATVILSLPTPPNE